MACVPKMAQCGRVVRFIARNATCSTFGQGGLSRWCRTSSAAAVNPATKSSPMLLANRCFTTSLPSHSPRRIDKRQTTADTDCKPFSTSQAIQYAEEHEDSDLVEKVNRQVLSGEAGRLFAVVHLGGLQRKVTTEDILVVHSHYEADIGERIRLNKVMLVGGKDFTLVGRPLLSQEQVKVEATVIEKTLEHTKIIFRYWRRKDRRTFKLYKNLLTFLRINTIDLAPLKE